MHKVYLMDNSELERLSDSSIHLTVASPPCVISNRISKFERGDLSLLAYQVTDE